MADIRDVVIVTYTPVRDGAELHGKVIGTIYGNYVPFQCKVDYAGMHDKWVSIVDPPTWKDTGKQGWVEWSHCVGSGELGDEINVLVTIYKDGRPPTAKIVSGG
jgi:hypothetical protein